MSAAGRSMRNRLARHIPGFLLEIERGVGRCGAVRCICVRAHRVTERRERDTDGPSVYKQAPKRVRVHNRCCRAGVRTHTQRCGGAMPTQAGHLRYVSVSSSIHIHEYLIILQWMFIIKGG